VRKLENLKLENLKNDVATLQGKGSGRQAQDDLKQRLKNLETGLDSLKKDVATLREKVNSASGKTTDGQHDQ
jgi:hypothetical protein